MQPVSVVCALPAIAPPPGAFCGAVCTAGVLHCASTFVATEPVTRLTSAPWPCEPSINRSKPPLTAVLAITSAGAPTLDTKVACSPCFLKKVRKGLKTFSAVSSCQACSVALWTAAAARAGSADTTVSKVYSWCAPNHSSWAAR